MVKEVLATSTGILPITFGQLAVVVASTLCVMLFVKAAKKVIGITLCAGIAILVLKYFGVL